MAAALLLTSFVNPQNGIHINDIVIWLCNIGYVLVLQSCIGYRTYMRLYTKVMLAEAAISLISFVIGDLLSLPLPLLPLRPRVVPGLLQVVPCRLMRLVLRLPVSEGLRLLPLLRLPLQVRPPRMAALPL